MPTKRKVVVWDVDGPINHGLPRSPDECYLPDTRYQASRAGIDPLDFVVDNKKMLALTMTILHENNVTSVIGSQRIQMSDDDPHYGKFLKSMYKGLDHIFGENRPFLKEDIARQVGAGLQDTGTNDSKNALLATYQKILNVEPQDIIFVDDHDNYRQPTEEAGHAFVHAPRKARLNSLDDNSYLYETLLRSVSIDNVYKNINNSNATAQTKSQFKQQLLVYQLNNLAKVTSWQKNILIEENKIKQSPSSGFETAKLSQHEETAKQVLTGAQYLIMNTKWDTGLFGGEKVINISTGIKNTIPKGMKAILDEIKSAQDGEQTWDNSLTNIESIATKYSEKTGHSLFNKRGETTQIFYDEFKKMLKESRKGDEPEPEIGESPKSP